MQNTDQRLYDFLEDVKANVLQGNPIEALRAIALDALLLAQDFENAQKRLDSNEGLLSGLDLPVIDFAD